MTDQRWAAHLVEGQSWGTTSHPTRAARFHHGVDDGGCWTATRTDPR